MTERSISFCVFRRWKREIGGFLWFILFDLCTYWCSFTFQVNWCKRWWWCLSLCASVRVCVCVCVGFGSYLCLPHCQPGAWQLYRAFIPSRSLGMQRMPPRLSWSQCPSSSYSLSHTHPHTHTPARPQMQTHAVFISIFTRTFTDFHSFFIHFHNLTRTLKLHRI